MQLVMANRWMAELMILYNHLNKIIEFGILESKNSNPEYPDEVDVLMIVKPTLQFTEEEKLKIDQFVMQGGKLLCFIDNLFAEQDSLAIQTRNNCF